MKRVLKIVIPLVVVLALLGTAAWFFLSFRADLTAGFLRGQAAKMVERERYSRAVTYYNWAWQLDPENQVIPLAQAAANAGFGNYTTAEYTLVRAISARPQDVDLYVALCQVYVAQDKLLDAVQMLDRTSDAEVKAALDELRPAAPVLSPENGYYTEYIQVAARSRGKAAYLSPGGD